MAILPEIPAQRMAVEYVQQVAKQYPRKKLRLGGHSKGGNLAVWSAVFCGTVQRRVEQVWSNDGPGFHQDLSVLPEYQRIAPRVTTIIPKSSIVGMILEHEEDHVVVDSSEKGMMQHDGFSWVVLGGSFVRLRSVTRQGRRNDLVLKEWVRNMPMDQREKFVEGLFAVLSASGARTLTDLKADGGKAAIAAVKAMKDMEKDTREALSHALRLLLRSTLKVRTEELQQETEEKLKGFREVEQKLKGLRDKLDE